MAGIAEVKAQLDAQVAAGQLTEDEAMTILARFAVTGSVDAVRGPASFADTMLQPVAPVVSNPASARLGDLKAIAASDSGTINPDYVAAAVAELEGRAAIQGQSFFETLQNPDALERIGRTALKSPSALINGLVNGIPGLVGTALGMDNFGTRNMNEFLDQNQRQNDFFGVSDAITPVESLAENSISALMPGGVAVKASMVGVDFMVDQTIRELTSSEEGYETVFDKTGISEKSESWNIHPLLALPVAIAGGFMGASVINKLRASAVVPPPTLANVNDFDKVAPGDLQSLERSSDAILAYTVDEVAALERILQRAGLPNQADVAKKISLNSHAAANVRSREAVNTGTLSVNGRSYRAPVAVRQIYQAAMDLPVEVRLKLERYLNAKDALDDVRIAIAKNMPGNHAATEARLLSEIGANAAQIPRGVIRQFEPAYQAATQAARDFMDGDLLSPAAKLYLDTNRRHYVPLDLGNVDPKATLIDRIIQANREAPYIPDDAFLKERGGSGSYDLDQRGSPFELLVGYTQSMARATMKNDARLAIVDGLMNSAHGKTTMRLVKDGDDIAGNQWRLVTVYRNGEKEQYITSQLQAQLMQFDPYIAQHPTMFIIKRIQEWNMVGPGSITFAPITAIRDTFAGAVLRQAGTSTGSFAQVAAAVPKQLWAKAQHAIATNLTAGLVSGKQMIPKSVWPNASRAALAQRMSNNYVNSLYHLANQAGGFDGSITRNNIVVTQNALGEVRRSLRDGPLLNNRAVDSIVGQLGIKGAEGFIDGFVALFDAVQNAPRFAALAQTVKAGRSVEDATELARGITGDVSRAGRYYRPDGFGMQVDAVDRGVTTIVAPRVGKFATAARETVPFVNPMIQGMRRLVGSFRDDPVGTIQRAWMHVGLPAFAAYSWNEMMGQEYNDYAMSRRSAYDVAMNMYIAIPGLPPEQGIEIPLPHELLMFNSPYTRSLHGLLEGESRDEKSAAMMQLAWQMLTNSTELMSPAILTPAFNMAKTTAPGGIFSYDRGVYEIREDYVGSLPQHIEQVIRGMFSANGDMAIQLAYALGEDNTAPFNTFLEEVTHSTSKRAVIVKGLEGKKTANVTYSLPAEYDRAKVNAMEQVFQYIKPETMLNVDGVELTETPNKKSTNSFSDAPAGFDTSGDTTKAIIGPNPRVVSVNPIINVMGDAILDDARRNGINISGITDRDQNYQAQIKRLKLFNSGHSEAIAEWEQQIYSIRNGDANTRDLQELLKNTNVDLETYAGRVKLINLIENERSYLVRQKLELYERVEEAVTAQLLASGMIPEGETFRIEKHLDPNDPDPFGMK